MNRITIDFLGRNTWALMDGEHCPAEMYADSTRKYRDAIRVMRNGKAVMPPLSYRLRWQTGSRFSTGIKYGSMLDLGVFWTVEEAKEAAAQMVERLLYT